LVRITITGDLVANRVNEGSSASFTAAFFNDSWTATAPTSARYRIDDPDRDSEILAWTTLTPATSNSITVTGAQNAIVSNCSRDERRQLIVEGNTGLSTQYRMTKDFWIKNLAGVT
jgi:hypothetical protein